MTDTRVAIVGGGISGLSAAYELQQRGVPHLLFEQTNRLGGVIRTDVDQGFTIDAGPDSLLVHKPAAIQLCEEIGLAQRLVPTLVPRTAYVVRSGDLFPLPEESVLGIPLGSLDGTGLLSAAGKERLALDLTTPAATTLGDESIGQFFRRRFGSEVVDYIAEPLLAGIHAGDVEALSMSALFPRLVEVERQHGSVIEGLRTERASAPPLREGMFRSLPGGLGELIGALIGALQPETLHTSREVKNLSAGDGVTLAVDGGHAVRADHVILTTPAKVTARLLAPLDAELTVLCSGIRYTSTATVVLSYPEDAVTHPLAGTGFVVPRVESAYSVIAGSWISSKWPGRAPKGQVMVRGFVGGARDPAALDRTDDELVAGVVRDFHLLLGISGEPALRRLYRWPHLNPQHEVGHLDRLAAIDERLAALPAVHITGAGFRGVGIPDCVAHGRATAAAVAETLGGRP